jgi:hypothetical protein
MKKFFSTTKIVLFIIKEVILTAIICVVGWILFKLNVNLSKNKK